MPITTGFNHVATLTTSMDTTVTFYERVFDARVVHEIKPSEHHPWMKIVDIGGGAALNIFEAPAETIIGERRRQGGRGAVDHFAFAVDTRETLEIVAGRLRAAGAQEVGEIQQLGSEWSLFFRDPDGMELEVCAPPTDPIGLDVVQAVRMSPSEEIRNLLHHYAELIDDKDVDGLLALFADAVITSAVEAGEWRGRNAGARAADVPELVVFRSAIHPVAGRQSAHICTNAVIELDGEDRARARSRFSVVESDDGEAPRVAMVGRYHDTFAVVDGTWRFTSRHFLVDVLGARH